MGELSAEERTEYITTLQMLLGKLTFLTNSLINMSRLESGIISLKPEKNSLNEIVLQAVKTVYAKAKEKGILITFECGQAFEAVLDFNWTAEAIEDKVLSMYARGMSQRDIADTVEDIYGFDISHETISTITDRVIGTAEEWQNRPLKKFYTFLFVDCIYVTIRKEMETKNCAVYVVLGYDADGRKDVLGLWIGESEGKHYWMQIFDEIRARGVEDVLFISMDGVSGLEEGAKSIFKDVVVQRCIVHLIRNSIRYIPSKDYKAYTAQLKKVYGAPSLKAAEAELERFKQAWAKYPGAVDVWVRNWQHVAQLYNYGSAVRKVMYTTNAIESVNSSLRKVTKKGAFPNEDAVRKAFYLRIVELYKKWNDRPVANWAFVRNQLALDDKIQTRILKYEQY